MPAILQAATYAAPYAGNFMAMLAALERLGEGHGYRAVLLLPENARGRPWIAPLVAGGRPVRFLPATATNFQLARAVATIAVEEDAVLVHTHFREYDVAAWLAARRLAKQGRRLGVVWHAHSGFPVARGVFRRVKDLFKYRVMGSSVRVIPVSEGVREQLRTAGVPDKNIRLVLNAIDLELAVAARRLRAEVRAELGILDGETMLFMFGWDPHRKGLDVAIDAVESLVGEGRRLVLVASGMEEMREFISARTAERPLSWLRPVGKVENIADLYQASDLFLCPSRSEGLAAAVLEALANRLPVIHSDVPAANWAREVPSVALCAPGDSGSLAAAVCKALEWPRGERERRTAAGLELVRNQFGIGPWAERVFHVYQELL